MTRFYVAVKLCCQSFLEAQSDCGTEHGETHKEAAEELHVSQTIHQADTEQRFKKFWCHKNLHHLDIKTLVQV